MAWLRGPRWMSWGRGLHSYRRGWGRHEDPHCRVPFFGGVRMRGWGALEREDDHLRRWQPTGEELGQYEEKQGESMPFVDSRPQHVGDEVQRGGRLWVAADVPQWHGWLHHKVLWGRVSEEDTGERLEARRIDWQGEAAAGGFASVWALFSWLVWRWGSGWDPKAEGEALAETGASRSGDRLGGDRSSGVRGGQPVCEGLRGSKKGGGQTATEWSKGGCHGHFGPRWVQCKFQEDDEHEQPGRVAVCGWRTPIQRLGEAWGALSERRLEERGSELCDDGVWRRSRSKPVRIGCLEIWGRNRGRGQVRGQKRHGASYGYDREERKEGERDHGVGQTFPSFAWTRYTQRSPPTSGGRAFLDERRRWAGKSTWIGRTYAVADASNGKGRRPWSTLDPWPVRSSRLHQEAERFGGLAMSRQIERGVAGASRARLQGGAAFGRRLQRHGLSHRVSTGSIIGRGGHDRAVEARRNYEGRGLPRWGRSWVHGEVVDVAQEMEKRRARNRGEACRRRSTRSHEAWWCFVVGSIEDGSARWGWVHRQVGWQKKGQVGEGCRGRRTWEDRQRGRKESSLHRRRWDALRRMVGGEPDRRPSWKHGEDVQERLGKVASMEPKARVGVRLAEPYAQQVGEWGPATGLSGLCWLDWWISSHGETGALCGEGDAQAVGCRRSHWRNASHMDPRQRHGEEVGQEAKEVGCNAQHDEVVARAVGWKDAGWRVQGRLRYAEVGGDVGLVLHAACQGVCGFRRSRHGHDRPRMRRQVEQGWRRHEEWRGRKWVDVAVQEDESRSTVLWGVKDGGGNWGAWTMPGGAHGEVSAGGAPQVRRKPRGTSATFQVDEGYYVETLGDSSLAAKSGGGSEPSPKQIHVALAEDWRSIGFVSGHGRDRDGQACREMVELYRTALSVGWRKDQGVQQADGKGHRTAALHVTTWMNLTRATLHRGGALLQPAYGGSWQRAMVQNGPLATTTAWRCWMVQQRRKKDVWVTARSCTEVVT